MDTVNILLVDDEPKNLMALEAVLAAPDRQLVHAHSGADALRALLRHQFAVVILDVHMPDMDGFETASLMRMHDRSRSTPIIFLTAANKDETHVSRGYSLGAVDYLFKPFDVEILRSKVAVFVDLFRTAQQVQHQADILTDTTAFLENVLQSTTDYAISVLNGDGEVVAWYEGAARLYGHGPEDTVGKMNARDLFSGGAVEDLFHQADEWGRASGEFTQFRRDGSTFPATVSLNQRTSVRGRPIGYVMVCKDMTEEREREEQARLLIQEQAARVQAEAASRRYSLLCAMSSELSRLLTDFTALDVVVRLVLEAVPDLQAAVIQVWAPRSWTAGASRHQDSILPLTDVSLPPVDHALTFGREWAGSDGTGWDAPYESGLALPLPGGSGVRAALYAFPRIPWTDHGDMDLIQDMAARIGLALENVRLYQEAQAALRARDDFFAAAYHDLRTPLAVIKGNAQLLNLRAQRLGDEGAPFLRGLDSIETATARMIKMVDEVLDVARMQSGQLLPLNRQRVDLVSLARNLTSQFVRETDRIHVVVQGPEESLVGEWDEVRLDRVLGNLLSNAIAYSPAGSPITMTLSHVTRDTDWALIQVSDRGVGIPSDELDRVFDRYFRARNVAADTYGTGIGLAGAKEIVEQHGGAISLHSVEGEGTTVDVWLPVTATPLETPLGLATS